MSILSQKCAFPTTAPAISAQSYPNSYQKKHYLKYEIHLNKCKHVIKRDENINGNINQKNYTDSMPENKKFTQRKLMINYLNNLKVLFSYL